MVSKGRNRDNARREKARERLLSRPAPAAPKVARESMVQGLALCCLLVMGGLAIAGPSGVLAWAESRRLLAERQKQVVQLQHDVGVLNNRVALLDPRHVDPDLAGELLRARLNVVHPDEMVLLLRH